MEYGLNGLRGLFVVPNWAWHEHVAEARFLLILGKRPSNNGTIRFGTTTALTQTMGTKKLKVNSRLF